MLHEFVAPEVRPLSAFLTGTSTEYLGNRPLPGVLRDRAIVFVTGPSGSGKSTVARSLGKDPKVVLDSRGVQAAIIDCVREGGWSTELLDAQALILDGPVWLHNRPGAAGLLINLLKSRLARGLRTVVCQADTDASITVMLEALDPGTSAVVALRFPKSAKARLRVAERICLAQGLPVQRARSTSGLANWSYRAVATAVVAR